ncbi:MAG TPA: heparin lyase I family protein [Solirubrobacterales bacterium]|nr:heparin lyase I family protein [Solirubrobacterales bacterium]
MRLSAPLTALLAAFALLAGIFAAEATAAQQPLRWSAASATTSKKKHRAHHRKANARARLKDAIHGKRGVSDNVSLTSIGNAKVKSKPKASAVPKTKTLAPGLLFEGAQLSDFAALEAAPGAFQEVPDPLGSGETVLQLNVNERDVAPITPTDNPRAQALSPDIINNGSEFWLQTKFMIPTNYPFVPHWMSLLGIYGAPYGGPGPFVLEVCENRLQWMRNGTYNWDVPFQMPLIKGSWVTVLMHQRFASDGFVELWINGQQINFFGREPRLNMQTADRSNSGAPNSARISQYREAGMFETGTLYFGALKIGTTRESVGG